MSDDEYERRYMRPGERVVFREKVVSQTAFRVSVVFAIVFGLAGALMAALGVVNGGLGPAPLLFGVPSVLFGVLMGVLGVMFSVFRVMITGSDLHVHFGWSKRKIPLGAIQSVKIIELKGFRQGKVQIGLDGVVRTWVGQSKSGSGIEITYQIEGARKHILTIGSDNPEAFANALATSGSSDTKANVKANVKADTNAKVRVGDELVESALDQEDVGAAIEGDRDEEAAAVGRDPGGRSVDQGG
jgi:hypothetical protein